MKLLNQVLLEGASSFSPEIKQHLSAARDQALAEARRAEDELIERTRR
jgi:hypothetical protein